jgi:hypothetical protein
MFATQANSIVSGFAKKRLIILIINCPQSTYELIGYVINGLVNACSSEYTFPEARKSWMTKS